VVAWDFDRGFVGHVTIHSKRFVAEGDRLFAQDPIRSVKFVKLSARAGSVPPAALFACPSLARAEKLNFDGSGLWDQQLEQLAASPHVARLRSLALSGTNSFTPTAIRNVLHSLRALNELLCGWNSNFTDAHVQALAASPELARVSVLDMGRTAVTATGVIDLVSSRFATGLTSLLAPQFAFAFDESQQPEPVNQPTRESGVRIAGAVGSSKSLGKLRELDLTGRLIGDAGLALLARSSALPALRELRLGSNELSMEGVRVLSESALGQQLYYLSLEANPGLAASSDRVPELFPDARVEIPH
jgi:hypothetical protein